MTTDIPSLPTTPAGTPPPRGRLAGYAQRQPIAVFLAIGLALGWTALTIPNVTGQPAIPYLLAMLILLLGTALLVTRWADGPGAVRRLLGRALLWRFEPWRYAVILLGMPAATYAVSSALGTAATPDNWTAFALGYLFQTVVFGCLLGNLWEETVWTGFVQARFMERHGLLIGSLLTSPWFFAIHIPLSFGPGWTWSSAGFNLALLLIIVPVMRYLLGMHYLDTRGSLLAVGLQHAAFNASADLGSNGWEYAIGLIVLTVVVAALRQVTQRRARNARA